MHKVLVVDDEPQVANALRRVLSRQGFEVEIAADAAEGLRRLESFAPDAVISDYRMPGMNGAEFLAQVKRRAPYTFRIIISGFADLAASAGSGWEVGIDRFLPKPWDRDELVAVLRAALARRAGARDERS